jgi:hypothetical protein
MSRLTGSEIGSLKETYTSIYENVEVTENQIIESIAYTLISNGYSAVEVLEYFANIDYETFIEDINYYSNDDLIVENLSSEEYIEEQMQKLYEIAPLVGLGLGAAARAVLPAIGRTLFGAGARQAAKGALSGAARLGGKVLGNVWKGAKEPAKQALQTLGKFGVKLGVPTGVAAAADQFISGGKGREYVGAAVQGVRQAARNIPSPQKAADAIKNVKPPKLPELPATAKSKPPETPKPLKILGGKVVGYDHFDMVDNHSGELLDEAKGRDFALKGGRPGFITPKGWFPIDTKTFDKKELDRLTADYTRRRGSAQIQKDIETHKAQKAKQDAARQASQQKPAAAKPEPTKPAAAKPEPTKPKPTAQTGDRTKDLTTWARANERMISKVGTQQQRAILAAAKSGSAMPAPRPISKDIGDLQKMQKASQERQAAQSGPMYSSPDVQKGMSSRTKTMLGLKDSYDIVLDYLFSQGHVDTLEEALYVMMEMDSKCIQSIVEGVMPEPIDPVAHKAAQKTQKIYNLGKGTNNPNEAQSALKRTGPQLPGV